MKKFKLFALAAFAMLSTNAFAAADITEGAEQTKEGIRYKVLTLFATETTTNINTVEASLNGLTGTTIAIPDEVTFNVKATKDDTEAAGTAIDGPVTFKVVKVGSFAGLSTATTLTVGANVAEIATGAFVGTKITSLDLSGTKVTAIDRWFTAATPAAAQTNATLTSVSLPACAATIAENAFNGCTALTTVTFADLSTTATNVTSIGAGAFAKTAIVSLDLTKTKITALNALFEEMNTTLTSVTTPATLTSIESNAFKKVGKLATLNLAASIKLEQIKANAFNTTPSLTTLTVPAGKLVADALAGSSIKELTYSANIATASTIGAIGAANLTKVTFSGNITVAGGIAENAFKASTKLATANFTGQMTVDGAVAAGAFTNAGTANTGKKATINGKAYTIKLTVNYTPATANEGKYPFPVTAFAADATDDDHPVYVKLSTSTSYAEAMPAAKVPNRTVLGFDPTSTDIKLAVSNNGTGSYYYGIITQATGYKAAADYKICGKQGDAKVMVYAAYIDQDADGNHVYMQQLKIIGGYYLVKAGSNVVVKSTSDADVVINAYDGADGYSYLEKAGGTADMNELKANDAVKFASEIKTENSTKDVYFLMPFDVKNFTFQPWSDSREVKKGWYYILFPKTAAARLTVTWLDGSEDDQVTAIQSVKTAKAEKGAIYNLAGQKVNAAYKGVVIKDGKKYIQK